jgi:RHS repeat-associated protein
MVTGKNKTMQYDAENRLIQVNESGIITSFSYDGDGGRVKKTTVNGPQTMATTYIGSLFEKDSDGKTRRHIFAGANRTATVESTGATYYYHSDHLGSSNVITNQSGAQAQYAEYTPYGSLARNEGADVVKYKFTGKELDRTGLYYYGARYYDPEIGRFITADPTVQRPFDPQDLNRYAYCRNNPLNFADPSGYGWLKNTFDSLNKFIENGIQWLEKVTNTEWDVNASVRYSVPFDTGPKSSSSKSSSFYSNPTSSSPQARRGDYYSTSTSSSTESQGSFTGYSSQNQRKNGSGWKKEFDSMHGYKKWFQEDDAIQPFPWWQEVGALTVAMLFPKVVMAGLSAGENTVLYYGPNAWKLAAASSGTPIFKTAIGGAMNWVERSFNVNFPRIVWDAASAIYAAGARGTVQVFSTLSEYSKDYSSTFYRVEAPIIEALCKAEMLFK